MLTHDAAPGLPPIVQLAKHAAAHLGYDFRVEDEAYGYLFSLTRGHRKRYFVGGLSALNDAVSSRVAQDKYYTSMVLASRGIHVPEQIRCIREGYFKNEAIVDDDALERATAFARRVGYPVIVKPNRMSLGRDVMAAHDETQLYEAMHTVWKSDYIALVQRVARGQDVRLDFLDGSFLAGYCRTAVCICGDGERSVRQLLCEQDERFADAEFFAKRRADGEFEQALTARGYDETTVLRRGEAIGFDTPVLNLNRWATARVLDGVTARWRDYCVEVGEVLGLRHFGLDLRVPCHEHEPWQRTDPQQSVVIEVNASPALVQLHNLGFERQAIEGQARVFRALFEGT